MSDRLRVLFIGPADGGGISTVNKQVIDLLTSSEELEPGIINTSPLRNASKILGYLALYAITAFKIGIARYDIAYLQIAQTGFLHQSIFLMIAKVLRCRTIAHFHAHPSISATTSRRNFRSILFSQRYIDDLIVLGGSSKSDLLGHGWKKRIHVVANFVDPSPYPAAPLPFSSRSGVLFLGRMTESKGIFKILELARQMPNEPFKFIGAFEDRKTEKEFQRQSSALNNVRHLGAIYGDGKLEHIARAKCLLLMSKSEVFPMTIIEAALCGTPSVSTPVGMVPDLIRKSETGYLVSGNDLGYAAEVIAEVVEANIVSTGYLQIAGGWHGSIGHWMQQNQRFCPLFLDWKAPCVRRSMKVRLKCVGDVMLGETLENYRRGVLSLADRGINPFEFTGHELAEADVTLANLECVVTDCSSKTGLFREILRAPKRAVKLLQGAGINLVNLANNHTLDHGGEALLDTIANLDACGIQHFGFDRNSTFQQNALIIEKGGLRLGFLGYNLANFSSVRFRESVEMIKKAVSANRPRVDFLTVSLHWGEEYVDCPQTVFCAEAKAMFALGVDFLYGHHSHRLQGLICEDGKLFAPSLGNFIFDDRRGENRLSCVLDLSVATKGVEALTVKPFWINERLQPVPLSEGVVQMERLNRKLQDAFGAVGEDQQRRFDRGLAAMSWRGHMKNRLRMRLMICLNIVDYLHDLRAVWRFFFKRGPREFSISDS